MPFILESLKNHNKFQEEVKNLNINKYDDYEKRGLIIQTQQVTDDEELSVFSSRLVFYITLMNNYKSVVDWEAIEHVIESDFLTK